MKRSIHSITSDYRICVSNNGNFLISDNHCRCECCLLVLDTHHSCYLPRAQVVHDGAAVVGEGGRVAEQRVHRHLRRHPKVRQLERLPLLLPLRDVQQPLARRVVLEQVGDLKKYIYKMVSCKSK